MALSLALDIPEQLGSVLSIAGRILPGALDQTASSASLQHLGLVLMHGSEDELVPASESQRASEHFHACGLAHTLRLYPAGHTISPGMFKDLRAHLSQQLDTSAQG